MYLKFTNASKIHVERLKVGFVGSVLFEAQTMPDYTSGRRLSCRCSLDRLKKSGWRSWRRQLKPGHVVRPYECVHVLGLSFRSRAWIWKGRSGGGGQTPTLHVVDFEIFLFCYTKKQRTICRF